MKLLSIIPLLLSVPLTWQEWGNRFPKIIGCKNGTFEWIQTSSAKNPDDFIPSPGVGFDPFAMIANVDLYLRLPSGKVIKESGVAKNWGVTTFIKSNSIEASRGTVSMDVSYKGEIICLSDKFDGNTEGFYIKVLR